MPLLIGASRFQQMVADPTSLDPGAQSLNRLNTLIRHLSPYEGLESDMVSEPDGLLKAHACEACFKQQESGVEMLVDFFAGG